MKAWVHQDNKQVKKHGSENTSWYVSWMDPEGTRRCKSCGPGEDGRLRAESLKRSLESDALAGIYTDPVSYRHRIIGLTTEEIKQASRSCVVYFVEAVGLERIKIGVTADLARRLYDLECSSPVRLKVLAVTSGSYEIEKKWHRAYRTFRLHGEWFQATRKLRKAILELKSASANSMG